MLFTIIWNILLFFFVACVVLIAAAPHIKCYIQYKVLNLIANCEFVFVTLMLILAFNLSGYHFGCLLVYGTGGAVLEIFGWIAAVIAILLLYGAIYRKRVAYVANSIDPHQQYLCKPNNSNAVLFGLEKHHYGKIRVGGYNLEIEIVFPENYLRTRENKPFYVRCINGKPEYRNGYLMLEPCFVEDLVPAPVFREKVYDFTVTCKYHSKKDDYKVNGWIEEQGYRWTAEIRSKSAYETLKKGDVVKVTAFYYVFGSAQQWITAKLCKEEQQS